MTVLVSRPMLHFGKLPARGDFVRSAASTRLMECLDRWCTAGMQSLVAGEDWKSVYDRAVPFRFAFVSPSMNSALAGHVLASRDSSGRRFPFLTAVTLPVAQPDVFISHCPLLLRRPWLILQAAAVRAHDAREADAMMSMLAGAEVEVDRAAEGAAHRYDRFIDAHTVGSLETLLRRDGHRLDMSRLLTALGLLLDPVAAAADRAPDKGLALPLPHDDLVRPFVASLWIDIVSCFLGSSCTELALFEPCGRAGRRAALLVWLDGAAACTLHAMLDPDVASTVFIDAARTEWVERCILEDPAAQALGEFLRRPALPLRQAFVHLKLASRGVTAP
jgi:type VI secretion system protein ImpM